MAIPLSIATTTHKTSMFNRAESTTRVHGQLCLRFEARGDRNQTILAESKQQLPLRSSERFNWMMVGRWFTCIICLAAFWAATIWIWP